jgi:hypothetical protein
MLKVWLANLTWRTANASKHRHFLAALSHPRQAQEEILRRIVRDNTDTVFGREYQFADIRSVAGFQERVPLSTYDEYTRYIQRIQSGEPRVLTRSRVTRLIPSSGSTAPAKLIPFTVELQREFQRAIGPWIYDLYGEHPDLMRGPAYWSITPALPAADGPSAVPIGFDEDTAYLGGCWRHLVDATMAVPSRVSRVEEPEEFWAQTVAELRRARELRLISVWHPSFLALLVERLGGPHECRRLWPRLALISCWADGPAAMAAESLRQLFPDVPLQGKGLLATEAFVSLPFQGRRPVAITSHFFEFCDDTGRIKLTHELERDANYSVVVTTSGGLYRYRLHDRVRVDGFVAGTPSLTFVGKEDHVTDLCGEKLSEGFVAETLAQLFAQAGLKPRFAMLAPDALDDVVCYTLFTETDVPPSPGFGEQLEQALERNPHYAHCVRLGQLATARLYCISGNGFEAFATQCRRRGLRLGNIKPAALSAYDGWAGVFEGRYLSATRGSANAQPPQIQRHHEHPHQLPGRRPVQR